MLLINPANIYVNKEYRGEHASGNDIALIGFDKNDYAKIEEYIYKNQMRVSENERQRSQYFFKENNLFH